MAGVRDKRDRPHVSAAMAFAIQEVVKRLQDAEDPQLRMDASTYDLALDEAAVALGGHGAPVASPLGSLCSLLQEDRRLRYLLAERWQCAGEV